MKKNITPLLLGILALWLSVSCGPSIRNMKSTGDPAHILLQDEQLLKGELLAVSDSALYIYVQPASSHRQNVSGGGIFQVNLGDLKSVKVKGYSNKKWIGAVLVFQVVPIILLGIAASSEDADAGSGMAILSLPVLLTTLLFVASTPPEPGARSPVSPAELEKLRKYARFPQGLTPSQLEVLLAANHQEAVRRLE